MTVAGLVGAVILGVVGLSRVGWPLIPFMVLGPVLVVAYNWELFGGLFHSDLGFALAWGSFPVLVAYVAQTGRLATRPGDRGRRGLRPVGRPAPVEHPARMIRRRANRVEGQITLGNGDVLPLDRRTLLAPLETALHAMSWGVVLLAAALAIARLH